MRVTIAICTWNRCELLRQGLERLTRIAVPPGLVWDVLVVNNNCTDQTDAVIADFSSRLPLRRVFEKQPGIANARNAALAAATTGSAEYLLFVDDDVLVDQSWLVEFAAASRTFPEAAAIGGIIEPWFPHDPDPELCAVFPRLSIGFCGTDYGREPGPLADGLFIWTSNIACQVAAITGMRFDPTLGTRPTNTMGGEDTDFIRRLRANGELVLWWPSMKVRHYVEPSRMTLEYLLRHQVGDGMARVLTVPQGPAPSIRGVPRWLVRKYVETSIRYWLSHITRRDSGPTLELLSGPAPAASASQRVRDVTWRREMAFLRGMARGYRRLNGWEPVVRGGGP